MASSLWSWLGSGVSNSDPPPPVIRTVSPPPSDSDSDSTERGNNDSDHDDAPPAFPSLSSAQRATSQAASPVPRILTDTQLMPPPPLPEKALRVPGVVVTPSSSLSASLAPPPTTTRPPVKLSKNRNKVALAPGHSSLDWANLKSSGQDLRVRRLHWQLFESFR